MGAAQMTLERWTLFGPEVAKLTFKEELFILRFAVHPADVGGEVRVAAERLVAVRTRFVLQLQMNGLKTKQARERGKNEFKKC